VTRPLRGFMPLMLALLLAAAGASLVVGKVWLPPGVLLDGLTHPNPISPG